MGALLVKSDPTETCPRPRSRSITEPAREAGPRCPAPAQAGPETSSNSLGVQGVYRPRQGQEEPKPHGGGGGGATRGLGAMAASGRQVVVSSRDIPHFGGWGEHHEMRK